MIAFLSGVLRFRTPQAAYIDVQGVGYEVFMAQGSIAKLPDVGMPVEVLTYLQVREDAMVLYGFLTQEEKATFEKLLGVTGVGPKVALSVLSLYSPSQLAEAVSAQDVGRIAKVPGIGKKTASRIILELKGSLDVTAPSLFEDTSRGSVGAQDARAVATEALLSMGFTSREAELALTGAPEDAGESALLQYALKHLGS